MAWTGQVRGSGRPVLVLPGFGLDAAVTAVGFEPAFAGTTGWQRRYLDPPGMGDTPAGPEQADGLVTDLVADVEALGRPVALAGHSYGGYLAAAVTRRRPDLVEGLLLVCSGVRIRQEDRTVPPADLVEPAPDWLEDVPPDLRDHLTVALGRRDRATAARVAGLVSASRVADPPYLERLKAHGYQLSDEADATPFAGPVALICGRADRVAGHVDQHGLLDRYPRASYSVLDGVGHYLPFEAPQALAGLVREWLARLAR